MKRITLKKAWHFLWEENSLLSWVLFLLVFLPVCFIVIKLIFFPLVSLIFSSPLPFVIVESKSMEHEGNFDDWWGNFRWGYETINITKEEFLEWPLKNGFNKGDIMIIAGSKEYKKGEIVVFEREQGLPIIHRIIFTDPIGTKGDNNKIQLSVEKNISEEKILGKAIFAIPKLGYPKLFLVDAYNSIFNKS